MSWYGIGGHHYGGGPDIGIGCLPIIVFTIWLFSAGPLINFLNFNPWIVHSVGWFLIILSFIISNKYDKENN